MYFQNIGTTTRNVWFDQRFAQGGFAPPWFPSTTVTPTNSNFISNVTSSVQRTQWLAAYQNNRKAAAFHDEADFIRN